MDSDGLKQFLPLGIQRLSSFARRSKNTYCNRAEGDVCWHLPSSFASCSVHICCKCALQCQYIIQLGVQMQSFEGSDRNGSTTSTECFSKQTRCAISIDAPGSSSKRFSRSCKESWKFTQEAIINIWGYKNLRHLRKWRKSFWNWQRLLVCVWDSLVYIGLIQECKVWYIQWDVFSNFGKKGARAVDKASIKSVCSRVLET